MTSHVPIHARNHRLGGVDPIVPELARARVWGTHAIDPFTIAPGASRIYPFNHGWTSHPATLNVEWSWGETPAFARIVIKKGGVYSITYRFHADTVEGDIAGSLLTVDVYEPAPDFWDGWHATLAYDGTAVAHSYVTTIIDDPDWLPNQLYCDLSVPLLPEGLASLTFGKPTYHTSHPDWFTGCYMEAARLGDADTEDWSLYALETPADEAVPDEPSDAPGLLRAVTPTRPRRGEWE